MRRPSGGGAAPVGCPRRHRGPASVAVRPRPGPRSRPRQGPPAPAVRGRTVLLPGRQRASLHVRVAARDRLLRRRRRRLPRVQGTADRLHQPVHRGPGQLRQHRSRCCSATWKRKVTSGSWNSPRDARRPTRYRKARTPPSRWARRRSRRSTHGGTGGAGLTTGSRHGTPRTRRRPGCCGTRP